MTTGDATGRIPALGWRVAPHRRCGMRRNADRIRSASGGATGPAGPRTEAVMRFVSMRIFVALGAALLLSAPDSAPAQSVDPKAGTTRQQPPNGEGQQKLDEFAEAASKLGGPAANPECVW